MQNRARTDTAVCAGGNQAFDRRRFAAVVRGEEIARQCSRRDHLLIGFASSAQLALLMVRKPLAQPSHQPRIGAGGRDLHETQLFVVVGSDACGRIDRAFSGRDKYRRGKLLTAPRRARESTCLATLPTRNFKPSIPSTLSFDLRDPGVGAKRFDAAGLGGEAPPSLAGGIDDSLAVVMQPVRMRSLRRRDLRPFLAEDLAGARNAYRPAWETSLPDVERMVGAPAGRWPVRPRRPRPKPPPAPFRTIFCIAFLVSCTLGVEHQANLVSTRGASFCCRPWASSALETTAPHGQIAAAPAATRPSP